MSFWKSRARLPRLEFPEGHQADRKESQKTNEAPPVRDASVFSQI